MNRLSCRPNRRVEVRTLVNTSFFLQCRKKVVASCISEFIGSTYGRQMARNFCTYPDTFFKCSHQTWIVWSLGRVREYLSINFHSLSPFSLFRMFQRLEKNHVFHRTFCRVFDLLHDHCLPWPHIMDFLSGPGAFFLPLDVCYWQLAPCHSFPSAWIYLWLRNWALLKTSFLGNIQVGFIANL